MKKSEFKLLVREAVQEEINEVDYSKSGSKLDSKVKSKASKQIDSLLDMLDNGGLRNDSPIFKTLDKLKKEISKA